MGPDPGQWPHPFQGGPGNSPTENLDRRPETTMPQMGHSDRWKEHPSPSLCYKEHIPSQGRSFRSISDWHPEFRAADSMIDLSRTTEASNPKKLRLPAQLQMPSL